MAASTEVEKQPGERCPDCGSGFAADLAQRGYRRHLQKLPKRHPNGTILVDDDGNPVMCGGTNNSWGKTKRD